MATIEERGPHQWRVKIRRTGYPVMTETFETYREAETWAATIEGEMGRKVFVDRTLAERSSLRA